MAPSCRFARVSRAERTRPGSCHLWACRRRFERSVEVKLSWASAAGNATRHSVTSAATIARANRARWAATSFARNPP